VELIFRRGPGNANTYMEVFNREGAYGLHPGTLELELSSKQLTIQVNRADVSAVYDVSLGCAVPFEKKGGSITLPTMIEPSMARMLALSTDGVIRLYEGNRDHGGLTDEQVCENVIRIAAGREKPREHVLIGEKQIVEFLAERGPEGIIISAEQPTFIPAAEKLAEAIRKAFGKDARISRNAPRIGFGTAGVGHRMGNSFGMVEQPDIILGNRDLSWNVAAYGNVTGRGPDAQRQKIATTQVFPVRRNGHPARLPIMTSLSFPGPGRSAVCLVRSFGKISQDICTFPSDKERPDEEPLPTTLVIGFSDVDGLNAAADAVVKLVRKAGK